ncbi:MAG: flagellar hook-basal body complex protein FliE [Halobacteriovoraceae bacterium]|nr:flagellar hook-basal body complex protein FliE [Halobacteriovoraceae bacterium]
MAIQNVGTIQDILNRYDAKSWARSAKMEGVENFKWVEELDGISPSPESKGYKTFGDFLSDSVNNVNTLQTQANESIQKLVTGENKNIHETMLQVEQAEIAFKTMNQIRQKVLDAYREVMKMQV